LKCFIALEDVVVPYYKNKKIEVSLKPFGSIANTFCLKGASDLDIVMLIWDEKWDKDPSKIFHELKGKIEENVASNKLSFAQMDWLFVISYKCNATGISVDVAINNVIGLVNTELMRTYSMLD